MSVKTQITSGTKPTLNIRGLDSCFYRVHIVYKEGVIRKRYGLNVYGVLKYG